MSQPDLFVVCKNCGSEVSPYVTECPYCGQRVRKRAPKIERGDDDEPRTRARRRSRSMPKFRRGGGIPGIAADTRPYATGALILIAAAIHLALQTGDVLVSDVGGIFAGDSLQDDAWRTALAPFVHDGAGYMFVALVGVGVFGTALERRFGWYVPLMVFLVAGAAGAALAMGADAGNTWGANGAALGLLAAWYVEWRLTRNDEDADRIGLWVFAAVLFGLSAAAEPANIVAAVGGASVGCVAGFALAQRSR